jgi:hypothetical protein
MIGAVLPYNAEDHKQPAKGSGKSRGFGKSHSINEFNLEHSSGLVVAILDYSAFICGEMP